MCQEQLMEYLEKNENLMPAESKVDPAETNTYEIVSRVAYLLGVPVHIFENEHEPPKKEIYDTLSHDKSARIVRELCRLRTAIERNFGAINKEINFHYRSLTSMPELVPQDAVMSLMNDGISLFTKKLPLVQYIIELNRYINDRINNVRHLFPIWLCWDYLRDIFIMPDGLTEGGTKIAAEQYYGARYCYPYQMYMNWPVCQAGNILYHDKRFVTLLYEWNCDRFTDMSKVSRVDNITKSSIYEFLGASRKTVMVVDCENSDPYDLCAALEGLEQEQLEKISKIILYDDVHSSVAWKTLENYTHIPVEHILIQRVKENKSLVDIRLTTGVCREFYGNGADSFIVVSSDSDYWGLISAMPEARFLLMIEHEKCGPDLKEALRQQGIFYCYIDDFYSCGAGSRLKIDVLHRELHRYLQDNIRLNLHEMMDAAMRSTRVTMDKAQRRQFYDRFLKTMQMRIDEKGQVLLTLKHRVGV